jgi:hypothetical protein
MIAGALVSAGALERGPLHEGRGAILAWALLIAAAEVVGFGAAIMYASSALVFIVALALLTAVASTTDDLWSVRGVRNAARVNIAYFLHIPVLIPMMSGWLLLAYSNRQEPR